MVVKCSICYLQGKTKNLADIQEDGGIKVMRNQGTVDSTLIYAEEYQIRCGDCLNIAVYKSKPVIYAKPTDITLMWGTILTYYESSTIRS